jgi:dienelactone hydrolase
MRLTLAALGLLLSLSRIAGAAPPPEQLLPLAEPAGVARWLDTDRPAPGAPLVIILPDALGEDGRSEPYVDALVARGIASLVLGLAEAGDLPGEGTPSRASPAALAVALAWAETAPRERIGLLGFGSGARGALGGAGGRPTVALYPRCPGLPAVTGPTLILQGARDAEGCGEEVTRLPGAAHGWDAPGTLWPGTGPMLPDPAEPARRRRAEPDADATRRAADLAAEWLAARLGGNAIGSQAAMPAGAGR